MVPLGLLVTRIGHPPVSGMTDITSIVWPTGHSLCRCVSEWPPGHGAGSGEDLVLPRLSVTRATSEHDDGLVVLQVESEEGGVVPALDHDGGPRTNPRTRRSRWRRRCHGAAQRIRIVGGARERLLEPEGAMHDNLLEVVGVRRFGGPSIGDGP